MGLWLFLLRPLGQKALEGVQKISEDGVVVRARRNLLEFCKDLVLEMAACANVLRRINSGALSTEGGEELVERGWSRIWFDTTTLELKADGVVGEIDIFDRCFVIFVTVNIKRRNIVVIKMVVITIVVEAVGSFSDAMFIRNYLPKFGTDLVTALTTLNTDDFTHVS